MLTPISSNFAQFLSNRFGRMFFQFIVYFLVPLALAFYLYAKKKLNHWQERDIPCLPPSIPLGNMNGVGQTVHIVERNQEIYEAFKKNHKIAGYYSMLKPTLMLLDLELIKCVLIKDFNNFVDRGVYYNEDADPVSAHM